jgi:hypothetical protein
MDCDICFDKFDKSIKKPIALLPCLHTICFFCLNHLEIKICPSCNSPIADTKINWSIYQFASESEYDKVANEMLRLLSNRSEFECKIAQKKKEAIEIINGLKKDKKREIESKFNELIKHITNVKRQNLKCDADYIKNQFKKFIIPNESPMIFYANEIKSLKLNYEKSYNQRVNFLMKIKKNVYKSIDEIACQDMQPNNLFMCIEEKNIIEKIKNNDFDKEMLLLMKENYELTHERIIREFEVSVSSIRFLNFNFQV